MIFLMDNVNDYAVITISSASEKEDGQNDTILEVEPFIKREYQEPIYISSEDDDVYFVPRPRKKKMISEGDEDLPRIRRERRNRNHHPRLWTKSDESPKDKPSTTERRETLWDDEPPRIPPLPDLSHVLPDLKPDLSTLKHHARRDTQTSKENLIKGDNRLPKKCQPIKKKRKSVDFYKSQSNAILGELFSLSDSDSCMITSWSKSTHDTHARGFDPCVKTETDARRRNSSECSRSRNSSGSSVLSTDTVGTPCKRSQMHIKDNLLLHGTQALNGMFIHGDEQQRKRLKKETKITGHQKHLSQTKSLKSLSHKKSNHRRTLQNCRSASLESFQQKNTHLHLPERSISVDCPTASPKAGAFEVLSQLADETDTSQDSDASVVVESSKIDDLNSKHKYWRSCTVKLTRLLNVLTHEYSKPKHKNKGIAAPENVIKAERHFLDGLPAVSNKAEGCDSDSITVDLLSVSESNDEDVEEISKPDPFIITDSESLPDISDNEIKNSFTINKCSYTTKIDLTKSSPNISLKEDKPKISVPNNSMFKNPLAEAKHFIWKDNQEHDKSCSEKLNETSEDTKAEDSENDETSVDTKADDNENIEKSEDTKATENENIEKSEDTKAAESEDNETSVDIIAQESEDGLDTVLNYSLKSNEFSDISDDEKDQGPDYSLKDKQFSDVSDEDNNVNLDFSFKSENYSDISDMDDYEVTGSQDSDVSDGARKDVGLKPSTPIVKDKVGKNACDLSVKLSDKNIRNSEESLQEHTVSSTTDDFLINENELSSLVVSNSEKSTKNNSDSVLESDMPILEKMSLELYERSTSIKDIPELEPELSKSSTGEGESLEGKSTDSSNCDAGLFSKFLQNTSNCDKNTAASSNLLSSSPKRPPTPSITLVFNISGDSDTVDTLPGITPRKSRKRKIRCRRKSDTTPQGSVVRPSANVATRNQPRLDAPAQTAQLSKYLKEYLMIEELNPGMCSMPDVCHNMVTACDEEEDHINIDHSMKFLNHFSKKYFIPNDLFLHIIGSTFYSDTCKQKQVHKCSSFIKTIDRKYPGHYSVRWEDLARCLDVITSIKEKTERETMQASSLLQVLVQILKNDLFSRDLSDSREIHRSSAYRLLSYDVGSSGRRQQLVCYVKREFHAGNRAGRVGAGKDVFRGLQELLSLAIDSSSSCVDCANTLAGELMTTYVYLPHVQDKHALLESTCAPLLRYKLVQLVLESQYVGTLPLCGFPESLQALVQCFFRATPLINPLTPPLSPQGEDQEEVPGGRHDTVYSPADTEELAMLLYHSVDSYLRCTQEKSYMALRRRFHCDDRELRDSDREELGRLPDHVTHLERHLRRMTPELSEGANHYLLLLTCLSDLA